MDKKEILEKEIEQVNGGMTEEEKKQWLDNASNKHKDEAKTPVKFNPNR